jgi:hypothetical protein
MQELDLETLVLQKGNHPDRSNGLCIMEAVAWVAGEPHSDHPKCVSPVVAAFCRRWQDDLDDAGRQRLKPYIPRMIGTAGSAAAEEVRAWLVTDWLVRVHTPAWLDVAGLKEQASALRALPPIDATDSARDAQPTIEAAREKAAAARDAAWAAARDAAWDAARAAAWAAARDAAWAAARDAAWDAARAAAWDAAWDAAWAAAGAAAGDAAWDAAWAAAWDAAWAALKPTVVTLQDSAFDLLDRMIEVGR